VPGQEADVLADRHRHARHDDLRVALSSSTCVRPAASVEQRLAGAGLAEQRDEVDAGFISRLSAKFCSRLRAVMPQTEFFACV
jgi:hypothetical protein